MPTFTILPHAWVKENYRLKPALRSIFMGLALLFGLASQALAAIINVPADQPTIAAAIAVAVDGDDIVVAAGTYVLSAQINLNKDVTIDGGNKATTKIQGDISLGQSWILISGAGVNSTIKNITFEKTDKNGVQEIIALQANGVTVENCDFKGQYVLGDGDVSRGFVVSVGTTGFIIQNCNFTNLRQPAYFNPGTVGQVLNCYVDQTRGWVVDGGSITFTGNTFGTNAADIAILVVTAFGPLYDPIATLSSNNDGAIIEDQRAYVAYNITLDIAYNTTIQAAIDAAVAGNVIQVRCGSRDEAVTVSRSITLQGAGNGSSAASNTILKATVACTGTAFTITANDVTIKNIRIKDYATGVQINAVNNPAVENLVIEDHCTYGINLAGSMANDITIIGTTINRTGVPATTVGIRAGTASGVDGLLVDGCTITNNNQGVAIFQSPSPVLFDNITIQHSTISNNAIKGMYFEKLRNALLSGLTMANNGTDVLYNNNAGIDINLKFDDYSDITIQNCDITNSGATGTAVNPETPVALAIKARDDGGVYGPNPATLDIVLLKNNLITGPQNGIRFGEYGTTNSTPTNITLEKNDLSWAYGNKAIISRIGGNVALNCNWHGSTDIPTINSRFVTAGTGVINLNQFLSNGADGNVAVGFQPSGTCLCPSGLLATNTTTNITYCSIQAAIADPLTLAGHTISVGAGTYNEDVNINKDLTIQGAGMNVCTVSGPKNGAGSTFQVASPGVIIDGFTITRDGNNVADWNNANGTLNSIGVAIQGQANDAEIRNCKITGNRNGIDVDDSDGNNIHNNIITFNRTGLIFRNTTDNTLLNENEITDNWTLGVLFMDASSGSNFPEQSAHNSSLNDNNISGNWYGQIVDRQTGGSLPAPGTTNTKDFECNWLGTTTPVVSTNNSIEPGYAAQIPVAYGGAAVPPAVPEPDILGAASANIEYLLFLVSGTDDEPLTNGFQPTPLSCTGGCPGGGVVINENSNGIFCSIQAAINAAMSNDRLKVKTGTYTENVNAVTGGKNIKFVPGNSPGCVTINGNYTLNAGDILEMEIEGTTACTQYDQFIVNGVVTLNGATLTLPMGMYFAQDGDQIVLIDNDLTDAVIGRFAQGNFATDGTNQYYINYAGGTNNNDVVLTKCCGSLLDVGIFNHVAGAPPAGHKLKLKVKPNIDAINAAYTEGVITMRTLSVNGVVDFTLANTNSPKFGYSQIGPKQSNAGYDYFIFHFNQVYIGIPPDLEQWTGGVEYDLVTLTYSCSVGSAIFELTDDAFAQSIGGKFYQELNGETDPGAQGIFYTPSATGPGVLSILASSNSPVCETMQIDLNSTTTGGSPTYAPYAWSGPNTYVSALADPIPFTATLAPPTAGIYQVSVTDGNGCIATATTTVVVPATGACVQNETNMPNNYYPTIKQAIDAVATITGDVLNVPAGTWPENVYVNKALTLNGVYKDISCDDVTRTGAESIITGGAGIAVAIQSNNVTINGFQLEGSTGVSSTGFNEVTIKNNKVNVREIGIASTLLVASALDPYSINDNCVDFPVQAFDQQAFNVNPTLSATQAPGVWYTDRYAPAGFVSTGVPTFRLKHSINASDCETCRPIAFQTAFYNTQGRKYDVGGTTAMSIQLYVATGWDVTNKRMAGFWGTALNAGNAISFYPIIEFTSDGSNPRFRGWNGVAFVDMGLPAGFAYDKWYTLNIAIDGTTIRYNVGDLSLILPGNGSVSIANVILQGHNTLAGVTYDINWDNLNTHGSDDTQTAPTVGILLAAASGTDDVTVQDNNVTDGFYGYVLSGVTAASADRTTVKGGTYTNLLQGVAVLNTLDGVNFAPSSVGVENVAFESFGGNYPNIPAANFHAGIYGFTGGSNPAHTVDILIKSVSLKNTGKTSQASAGLYLADFSTGAGNRLNATATLSTIQDNKNRGVQVRGANATASVSTSHILGNGADPFGAGGNHGFGIYSGVGAQVTLLNNFIANPAVQISDNVTALYEGVAPAATIIAHDNSIVRNSNGLLANTTSGTINGTNGSTTCNWWGNSNPNVFDEFILGAVTYDPYLPSGVDDDANPANGFQPDVPCQDLTDFYVNDNSLTGDLITFAVGLDAPLTRGTAHRPYRHINAAIGAAANGNTIRVDIGTYSDEQVLVNKDLTILGTTGSPAAQPLIDFTGAVTGKPTLMDVSVDGATIENIGFNVDLAKLKSAIIVSGVAIDNIEVLDNVIDAYGTPVSGNYDDRNAVSINYGGSTNYRVASGGVNSITFTGNTVNGALPESFFRAGVAVDEGGGTFSDNTLQTINQDIIVRFANNGNVTISDNTLNGGGVELADNNAGAGIFLVSNNDFDGTMSNSVTPRTAVLRLKNNQQDKVTTVSGNTFINHLWAISEENYKNVTVDNNDFTPLAGSTDFLHVGVNTKSISSNSNTIVQTTINGIFTNNVFNGSGTPGGTGIGFFNHDSDNDMIGTFTVGTNLNENEFAATIGVFARLDNQLGSTDPATFPTNYPDGGGWLTTMACWDVDVNLTHNKFDVGSGLQKPLAMNNAQRVLLEAKLFHKPDDACLGKFFQTVEVMAKVFLQGPYDGPSGKMNDNLRTLGGFPTSEPYTGINASFLGSFVEVNNTVLETITGSLSNLGDNSIVDWIWLELRDKNNSNTTLFTRSALVQRDGDIVDMDGSSEVAFPNAYQDNYYLMVRHRNHLACMTAATVDLTNAATMIDFTTAAQATFGNTSTSARRLIKTATYGLWAGNTFPKDEVGNGGAFRLLYNGSNNDRAPILTKVGFSTPLNVVTGYFIEDVNMNGEVKYSGSGNDRVIILNNVGASTPLNFITQEPNN